MRSLPWRVPLLLIGTLWIALCSAQGRTSADYFVSSLPGAPEPLLRMHAGLVEVTPAHHGNLFFWHFANRHIGDKRRTVIWLNGGPGCSSLDGALMEIGPYRVRDGDKLEFNNGSWDAFANLLFIDSPVGTGFSYVDSDSYVHELKDVADGVVGFLEKFFLLFPEYASDDLYVAGESFAGQYIPYVGRALLDRNRQATQKWNIAGLLIGNGWFSAEQYLSYVPYAYQNGLLEKGSPGALAVERQQVVCNDILQKSGADMIDIAACEQVLLEVFRQNRATKGDNAPCINMYDVRKTDGFPSCGNSWPEDLPSMTHYLRQETVRAALHVNAGSSQAGWQECNSQVHAAMTNKKSQPSVHLLPGLLAEIPILLFNGDRDLICNHLGQESTVNNLEFNNGKGMETSPGVTAPKLDWTFDGKLAGTYQEARNLTQVLFYNTSHMVPFDEAERSLDMANRFMGVDYDYVKDGSQRSTIDGENANKNSKGGGNATLTPEQEQQKVDEARWHAYYRSGEVALVVVIIAAGGWIWWVIRQRRRMKGYKGLLSRVPDDDGLDDDDHRVAIASGGGPSRPNGNGRLLGGGGAKGRRDLEAADFDETELDDLGGKGSKGRFFKDNDDDHFDIGDDSDEEQQTGPKGNGRANGHAHGGHK